MAVLSLGKDAYGVTIRKKVSRVTEKDWSIGAVYDALYRLEEKKYIRSFNSDPISARGGRSKKLYEVTGEGLDALEEHRKIRNEFEKEIDDLSIVRSK